MRDNTAGDQPVADESEAIQAMLVIAPDGPDERPVPVYDWLFAGRECAGIDQRHRLLIDDPTISRIHLELRLDLDLDQAWLTDLSTNGTRLNGQRLARSVPVRIMPGDRVRLGPVELQFRSRRFMAMADDGESEADRRSRTLHEVTVMDLVMVVGDIVGFSTIAESTDNRVLLENIDRLYAELRRILARHQGTLSNYVGDAFFATWEVADAPDAARAATAFAVEAAEAMPRIAVGLDLRDPGGGPLRMGWGVASGPAAVSLLTGMLVTVLGDSTNVAFRLSGLAGRDGRLDVLVTDAVHRATAASFAFTAPSAIQVKGRKQAVEIWGASRSPDGRSA
jgi:adenylate cyclase